MGTARLLGFPLVSRLGHQIAGSLEFDSSVSATWDFINGIYLGGSSLSYTGSGGTYFNSAGNLTLATTNQLRFDYDPVTHAPLGILIEGARTNVILWNRDLTNAAWTKTNVTAAKDQTGIDGGANSSSSITATAGNGTCLQAITLASSARFQTAYVKRLTGSGTIEMTMDNGSTWTAVTVTSGWTRVSIPTQTLANPTVGFRIVTSGDAIAVDYVQNENGAFPSSAILVTTTAAARAADVLSAAVGGWLNVSEGTLIWEYTIASLSASRRLAWAIHDGTGNNRILALAMGSGGTQFSANMATGGVSQVDLRFNAVAGQAEKVAYAWKVNDIAVSRLGGAVSTDIGATIPTGLTSLNIGHERGSDQMFGHLRRISYIPRRVSNVILQGLSS